MRRTSDSSNEYGPEQAAEIADRGRQESTLLALLSMVASGRNVAEILDAAAVAEELRPDGRCALYVVHWPEEEFVAFSAQGLPFGFRALLDELSFESAVGPCAIAAQKLNAIALADVNTDPSWQDTALRTIAIDHGLRVCQAVPVAQCGALVAFTEHTFVPRQLQQNFIASLGLLAGIALEISHAKMALVRADAECKQLSSSLRVSKSVAREMIEPLSGIVINACANARMVGNDATDRRRVRDTLRRTLRDCERLTGMIRQIGDQHAIVTPQVNGRWWGGPAIRTMEDI